MLFLCGLTYQLIRYNRACTSQGGIALSPWNPLPGRQQYPVRVTWRFLIRAAAYAALSDFEQSSKSSSNAGWLRSTPVSFAEHFRSVCRNVSGKLPSHAFAGLTALRGVPPRELLANNINSFATAPIKGFPPSPRLRRTREKGDGGPPPHKAMAGQVGEAGKNLSSKSA